MPPSDMESRFSDNTLVTSEYDAKCLTTLLRLKSEHRQSFGTILRGHEYSALRKWLESKTPLLGDGKYSFATRLYWVAHGLTDFPECPFCHAEKIRRNVDSFEHGYFRACSRKCPGMKAEKARKAAATCEERYGATSFMASEKGLAAKRDWCRRNGVENAFQLESVKEKSRKTKAERLGCEHSMQSERVRQKASANYARKTGYPHQFRDPAIVEKAKLTKESRGESGEGSRSVQSAANRAARYGAFLRNPEVEPLFPLETFTELDAKSQYEVELMWRCRKCGLEFEARLDQNFSSREGIPARCPTCRPFAREGSSGAERELAEFIRKEYGSEVIENDRTVIPPYELDIYVPEKKLAVEFDGLFWHSEQAGKSKDYHMKKTEACEKLGIRLVHVFEDEWLSKREIVESRLRNLFGLYSRTIYARKCEVREVPSGTSNAFQDENHM